MCMWFTCHKKVLLTYELKTINIKEIVNFKHRYNEFSNFLMLYQWKHHDNHNGNAEYASGDVFNGYEIIWNQSIQGLKRADIHCTPNKTRKQS